MAFYLKRKERVGKAVRRLCAERLQMALGRLKALDHKAVHSVRKDIKRLRATLRLFRAGLPGDTYRKEIRTLRRAAKGLSEARDAHIAVQALDNLVRHSKVALQSKPLTKARTALEKASRKKATQFRESGLAGTVAYILRKAARRALALEFKGKGWEAIYPGLKRSYRSARKAYQISLKDPSPENLHQWRKRVKDQSYQLRLLGPIWPDQVRAVIAELETLGDYLGEDHDLILLNQSLAERCAAGGKGQLFTPCNDPPNSITPSSACWPACC